MHDAAHGDPIARARRVERRFDDGATEWWTPAERGVEHGIDVAARPEGTGALVIDAVALQGTTAIVGAPTKDVGTFTARGAAYVFVQGHSNGDACTSIGDCVSGLCVDWVCCNGACTDPCEACDVASRRTRRRTRAGDARNR